MKPFQAPISRRSVLSLAALTGALVSLQPVIAQSAQAAITSVPSKTLRSIAPGAGVKKLHTDVFEAVAYLDQRLIATLSGALKLITTTSGATNQFQVLDAATGKLEFVATVPGKISSNIAYNPATGTVYVGRGDGHLASWTVGATTLTDLGRVASIAKGVYAVQIDQSGNVWGGSFPEGLIWTYKPATKTFTEQPRIDTDTDYVRGLAIISGTVYAGTGSINPKIIKFPVSNPAQKTIIDLPDAGATGFVSQITARGEKLIVFAEDSNNIQRCYVYNHRTASWEGQFPGSSPTKQFTGTETDTTTWGIQFGSITSINTATLTRAPLVAVGISSPRAIHVAGDKITVSGIDGEAAVIAEYSIASKAQTRRFAAASKPGSLLVQSLISGAGGLLYMGGYQGNGLASLHPDTGQRWQGPTDSGVNQIEHMMQFDPNSIFIGSYGSAKLYRYAPSLKATGKGAFKLIANLRNECMQSRPFGWAAAAGRVIVGTVPEYGHNGGALTIINPATNTFEVFDNFIDQRSIVGLHGDGDIVYGTTSNKGGYGTVDFNGPSAVFAYNVLTKTTLWTTELDYKDLYSPLVIDGELIVSSINGIIVLDPATGAAKRISMFRGRAAEAGYQQARTLQIPNTSKIVHNSGTILTLIDLKAGTRSELGNGPYSIPMAITPDGRLFVASDGTDIAELHLTPNATLASQADLVSITAAGTLSVEASNGRGAFEAPVNHGGAWGMGTLLSFHVVDWNADGVNDILCQRTDGSLQLHRGKVGGGFEAPAQIATGGWSGNRITTGKWNNNNTMPSIISISPDGTISAYQVNWNGTLADPVPLGTGWANKQMVMMDMDGDGKQGLVARSGATLVHQGSDGLGRFAGTEQVAAAAGWSDVTQLTAVNGHYYGKPGLLNLNRAGSLRYISATETSFAGIVNYVGDRTVQLLAGTRKFT